MGYADQKYHAHPQITAMDSGTAGTSTASGNNVISTGPTNQALPNFFRRTAVQSVRVYVITAPQTNVSGLVLNFLNGTNTFASVTVGSSTVGSVLTGTMSTAYNTFTSGSGPTLQVTASATAASMTLGVYDVDFDEQTLFVAGTGS